MIYKLTRRNRSKWSGILAYNSTFMSFQPAISAKTRRLNTGLTPEQEREFEVLLHMDKGTLTNLVDSNGLVVSSYWRDFKLDVPEDGIILDTDNATDKLYLAALKVSGLVANRGEMSDKAMFELFNEEETAVKVNTKRHVKAEAFGIYSDMSSIDKLEYAISKGHKADTVSPSVIDDIVGTDVESDPRAFIAWVKNSSYKKVVKLYKYVTAGIIRKAGNNFFYNTIQIGVSELTAVDYLERPSNQPVVTGILQEYDTYKNANKLNVPLDIDENNTNLSNDIDSENLDLIDEDGKKEELTQA